MVLLAILKHHVKRSALTFIESDRWVTNAINLHISGTNCDRLQI